MCTADSENRGPAKVYGTCGTRTEAQNQFCSQGSWWSTEWTWITFHPPTPPKKEKKNLGFLSPRKLDETRDSFHSFYFSLAATKGLWILGTYYEKTVMYPQSHTKHNPTSQSYSSYIFNKDENPGLHPHLKELIPAPFSFPFSSPPPPPFSLSFTHNKIFLTPIQTWQRSSVRNSNSFKKV